MPDSHISVIVTAYNRRRYLPDALRSLERQTLGKDKFEVIVVKNFEDPVSDEIVRRNGWKDVVTDVKPLGGKIVIGIQESRGEVITFLEDDDMYAPERLQVVEKKFREIRNLVYFHNDQVVVDEDGNVVPARIARLLVPPSCLRADLVVDERVKRVPCSLNYVKALAAADFNMSSIAVRRGLLGPRELEALGGLLTAVDLYLYARAFVGDGAMYLTPSRLTVYRVHAGNASARVLPWVARRYLEEGRLRELVERLRAARLATLAARLTSYPAVYELALANCGPFNEYHLQYFRTKFDWTLYSPSPLSIGRLSLPEALRMATIYTSLRARYGESAARLAEALAAEGGCGRPASARPPSGRGAVRLASVAYGALYRAVLYYLMQFLPARVKERVLETSLGLELHRGLKAIRGD